MIYVIGAVVLILVIFIVIVIFKYVKLKDVQKSIEMCIKSIDELLNKKLELVNSLLKDIDNKNIEEKFSYNEDASLYEREDILFNTSFEINKYIKEKKIKKLMPKVQDLNNLEEDIDGLKDYYNANVLNYNDIFLKKNLNKLFKLLKFDSYKSFKIRKLEEYEIFKNQSSLKLTGLIFFDIKKLLALENGLLPKNPYLAENGDG